MFIVNLYMFYNRNISGVKTSFYGPGETPIAVLLRGLRTSKLLKQVALESGEEWGGGLNIRCWRQDTFGTPMTLSRPIRHFWDSLSNDLVFSV